jgi:hypothetical protein
MIEKIKSGDFMVLDGNTPIFSPVVDYYSNPTLGNEGEDLMALNDGRRAEKFNPTHVQVIVGVDGDRKLGQEDAVVVVSCDSNGVYCRSVRPEEWASRWRIMSLKPGYEFTEEGLYRARKFCFSTIGHSYDYAGCFGDFTLNADLQDMHDWFCSEHVFMFYFIGGRPLQERVKAAFVKPRDCYVSPIVTTVARSNL